MRAIVMMLALSCSSVALAEPSGSVDLIYRDGDVRRVSLQDAAQMIGNGGWRQATDEEVAQWRDREFRAKVDADRSHTLSRFAIVAAVVLGMILLLRPFRYLRGDGSGK